jgi:cytochrome b pre-mRNA-processing protein 3
MTKTFFIDTRFIHDTPIALRRRPLNMRSNHERQAERDLGFLNSLFGKSRDRSALMPLYDAVVAEARRPEWYTRAAVPDTMDGRFDMVMLVLSLVLIRLEREGEAGQHPSALLTEVFVDDMDGTMREIGFGDLVVGKRVGGMMSALGGRLGAYRDGDRREALVRNLYRDTPPDDATLTAATAMVDALGARIDAVPLDALLAGSIAGAI